MEHTVGAGFLDHVDIGWNQITHFVEMWERLMTVGRPEVLPHMSGVDTDRLV
jgi:hypothetical protein